MTVAVQADGGRASSTTPKAKRSWAWIGLLPFFAFLTLFLIVPAISVFSTALQDGAGNFSLTAFKNAFSGQNRTAFWYSIRLSASSAAFGVVIGTLLAYAVATARRPRWLRSLVTSFSGVAANLGGVPLAFAFSAAIGAQGLLTKILSTAGYDLYQHDFTLSTIWGLNLVYLYFQIPLMLLITLPAIDGLKASWREAAANLGGTAFTYWRRVGIPVLMPSLLGGFVLLFANSFSAYATAQVLSDTSLLVPVRIGFYLRGDIAGGQARLGYALAAWMVIITGVCMVLYWSLRKRAERWRS